MMLLPKSVVLCEISAGFGTNYHTFLLDIFYSHGFQDRHCHGFPLICNTSHWLILFSTFLPTSLLSHFLIWTCPRARSLFLIFWVYIYFIDIVAVLNIPTLATSKSCIYRLNFSLKFQSCIYIQMPIQISIQLSYNHLKLDQNETNYSASAAASPY